MSGANRDRGNRDPWMGVPREAGEALRAGIPLARKRVIQAIRAEVPAYNQPLKGEFAQVVRSGVDGAMNRFIDMIERHDSDALGPSQSLFYDLGRRAFRESRTLDALLQAYQVGARVAWRDIVAVCKSAAVEPDVVYQLAESVIAFINVLSAASTEGYGAESAAAADVTQNARQELVELLAVRPPTDLAQLELAVQRARYCLPSRIAVLACAEGEPAELAARIGPGVIGARLGGLACVLVPELNSIDGQRLAYALNDTDAALGPAVPPEGIPPSWQWAQRTLRLMDASVIEAHGIVRAEDHLASLLLHGDESVASALSTRWLAPFQQLSERSRNELPETLLAWLAHNRNFPSAAAALHVHPHTVRYRLDKLRQLYGEALDDPDARFELELALRATGLRVRPTTSGRQTKDLRPAVLPAASSSDITGGA